MATRSDYDQHPARTAVGDDHLQLITEGPERLRTLVELIDAAQHNIRLLFYIFAADESGTQVRDALLRAIGRGVTVSLLTDGFGCSDVPADFCRPLSESGGRCCQFHPRWGRRYLLRNHQKMVVIDNRTAIVGGSNLSNHYFGTPADQAWRDLWLIVEGPAAERLYRYFDAVLRWAQSDRPRIRDLRKIIRRHSESKGLLQWHFGGPMRRWSPWTASLAQDIRAADRLSIIAAYFSPPRSLLRRIGRAAARGETRIITAAKSDNNATIAAARHTYSRLLRRGVRVFEYQPTKLHTKLVIAGDTVHIGSGNLDFRSVYINLELMLRIDDRNFADAMRAYFERELNDCIEITPALHRKRATWWRRLKWTISHSLVTSMDYTVTRRLNFGVES